MGSKNILIYIFAAIVVLGGAAAAYLHFAPPRDNAAALTPEAKAYVHNLKLGPVEMKARSFAATSIVTPSVYGHG